MDSSLIEARNIGDYRISIYYDFDSECPVTNWDLDARYLFEYNDSYHHRLHHDCNWKDLYSDNNHSLEDALRRIAAEVTNQQKIIDYYKKGNISGLRFIYNRHEHLWELQTQCGYGTDKGKWYTEWTATPNELKDYDFRADLVEGLETEDLIEVIENCSKDFVIKEWSSAGYSQGDYLCGVAYMTKEQYDKRFGSNGKSWKEHALQLIDAEVKEIGMWAWGDVKGFVLERQVPFTKVFQDKNRENEEAVEWEAVDSCYGFYMGTEQLIDEVIAEYGLKAA